MEDMGGGGIIAVDLGGTRLRAALCAPDGTIHRRAEEETRDDGDAEAVLEQICTTAERVWPENGQVLAISISTPGSVDAATGVVLSAPNVPGWEDVPLRSVVQAHFDLPVFVGNDANLAAIAEHRFGAGRGVADMIYVTISTGIGGGILAGGQLLLGHRGFAGEIGHVVLQPDGPLCRCGNRGCLEALASGTAIGLQAQKLASSGRAPAILAAANGDVARISAESVGMAAAAGDSVALGLLEKAGHTIGIAIANLMHLLNPQMFVLGGGVTQSGELLFKPIRAAARRWAHNPAYFADTEIVAAALGNDVSLLGALALARSEVGME
jgi:glucokinase